jgi:hypothetical protein
MATSAPLNRALDHSLSRAPAVASIPWYIWLSALGVTSAMIGVQWDISWHQSIGRDTFWTPAHLAIQLCGVIAGITCGYLILATTFTSSPLRASSVNVLGFRGPLGAFICAWGGFTMITSAPFDDWWHNAYGLDVKILSPPHIVLAMGVAGVQIGALVLIGAMMNRSAGVLRRRLETLFLFICSMITVMFMTLVMELTSRYYLHNPIAYRVVALFIPGVVAIAARATGRRWAATIVTAFYTAFMLGLLWILPLFPAQPKLGPVFHEVTQFIPNGFPLLLIVPAIALDLLWPRLSGWKIWQQALVGGMVFLAVYWAAEWPFADFLQSPLARNPLIGSEYMGYFQDPKSFALTYRFVPALQAPAFATGMSIAFACSILSMWVGLAMGGWLQRVRR